MKKLIVFFLPPLLRNWGIALGTALIIRLAAQAIFGDTDEIGSYSILVLGIVSIVGSVHIRQNFSWVKSLPISKTKIYLSSAALFLINLALGALTIFTYIKVCSFLPHTPVTPTAKIDDFDIIKLMRFPETIMTISVAVAYLILLFNNPFAGMKQQQIVWQLNRRRQFFTMLAILISIYAVIKFESYFFLGSLLVAVGWAGIVSGITRDYCVYPRPKKNLIAVASITIFAQISFIYAFSIKNLNSNNPDLILNSEKFLGSFSPTIDDSKLVNYFEQIKDPSTLRTFLSWHPKVLNHIDLKKWVANSDVDLTVSLSVRINPALITDDLRAQLLSKIGSSQLSYESSPYLNFLKPNVSKSEVFRYLELGNHHEFAFALAACRMTLNEECSAPIQSRLLSFNDSKPFDHALIKQSLYTLSIIHGKWIGLNDFAELKNSRASRKIASETVNCDVVTKKPFENLSTTEAAPFNHCVRKIALAKHREGPRIEHLGWISGSLYSGDKKKIASLLNN